MIQSHRCPSISIMHRWIYFRLEKESEEKETKLSIPTFLRCSAQPYSVQECESHRVISDRSASITYSIPIPVDECFVVP